MKSRGFVLGVILISVLFSCESEKKNDSETVIAEVVVNNDSLSQSTTNTNGMFVQEDSVTSIGELYNISIWNPFTEQAKDTFVDFDYLENNLHLYNGFNYSQFTVECEKHKYIKLALDSVLITIEVVPFDSLNHDIHSNGNYIDKIDGVTFWGTDGYLPNYEISKFDFKVGSKTINVDKEYYSPFYNPNLICNDGNEDCYVNAYRKSDEILITIGGSDGAGSYLVIYSFNADGKFNNHIVGHPF